MKAPVTQNESLLQRLVESARRDGDSKSVFGFLLLLEREIGSDAKRRSVSRAPADKKSLFKWQETPIFRRYIE